MPFSNREFVRGSDGRIYEINNDDSGSGLFIGFILVLIAIMAALQAAYLWLLSHYMMVGTIAIIGFVTWTGWVHHEYQQKEGSKSMLRKIISLLLILAAMSVASTGYSKVSQEKNLRNKIQGTWAKIDEAVELKIDANKFVFKIAENGYQIEADYTAAFKQPSMLILNLSGSLYKGIKIPSKAEPYSASFQCTFSSDTLRLWNVGTQQTYEFKKNE